MQFRAVLSLGLIWLGLLLPLPPAAAAMSEGHRVAIELARQGDYVSALARLEALRRQQPDDLALAYDQMVVAAWAERDAMVVSLAEETPLDQAPVYVLVAVAKAYRNQKFFPEAVALYRQALARSPGQVQARIGLAYALGDSGELEAARQQAATLRGELPQTIEVLMLCGYLFERSRQTVDAIDCYQRVLALEPGHRTARYKYLLALNAIGASHLAIDRASEPPPVLGQTEWRQFMGGEAAQTVRWGELPPRQVDSRFAETDEARSLLARNLFGLNPDLAQDRPFIQQARFDRLVALRDRMAMGAVVEEYEKLRAEGAAFPDYVLAAAADGYLYMEQPERARELYAQLLQGRPQDVNARLGLFYALIEMEDFPAALAEVDALNAAQPVWLHPGGSKAPRSNPSKLDTEVAATLGQVFAGDLEQAQQRFEQMRQLAPHNPDLRYELAGVYAGRGWPRRAEETYRLGLAIEPAHRGLQTGLAATQLSLNEFEAAEPAIWQLSHRYPEVKPVQRLEESWLVHNLPELRVAASYGRSSGSQVASRDLQLESTLFSSPVYYRYRGFVGISWNRGRFPEGDGIVRRYGLGVDYHQRDFEGEAALTLTDAADTNPGLRLGGIWFADDHWAFPAELELLSRDTPTRALRARIEANSLQLGARYRWSELRQVSTNLQLMDFSDDNRRAGLSALLRQRLQTRAQRWHDLELGLYSSTNSSDNGPYYSPLADASAELTLDNHWRLWRRYGRSFVHRLALTAGGYWQNNHGIQPVGALLYEHLWQSDERFELVYGAALSRRVYDGDGENGSAYYLRLNWRL